MAGSNIGMMDQAFFVGRKEIIGWLNETLQLNLGKVEETASGKQLQRGIPIPMHSLKF